MTSTDPIIGITIGDPAGIGPEIIAKAHRELSQFCRPLVIGDAELMVAACDICEVPLRVDISLDLDTDTDPSSLIEHLIDTLATSANVDWDRQG